MARKTQFYSKSPRISTIEDADKEFLRIQEAINALSEHVPSEVTTVAPDKVTTAQVRYADGVTWNPGKGEGLYICINGVWRKLAFA